MKLKDMSERRYTEKELIEIFKLAMNRQDKNIEQTEPTFTLKEIEKIGKDAGMNPVHLRNAAAQVSHSKNNWDQTAGDYRKLERWIPGKFTDKQIESMFAELKSQFGASAQWGWSMPKDEVKKLGYTYEYSVANATLVLSEQENGYLLKISDYKMFSGTKLETTILSIILSATAGLIPIGLAGEFLGNWWALIVAIPVLILSFFVVQKYTRKQVDLAENKLTTIADEAERYLLGSAGVEGMNEENDIKIEIPENDEVSISNNSSASQSKQKIRNH